MLSLTCVRLILAAACLVALSPAALLAQTPADPAEQARIHLGPLALAPRFALRNVGVDTNVFNHPDAPEQDFTASFGPGVDAWLRVGRARLNTQTLFEWTYFKKAAGQRAFNTTQMARVDVDLATFTPFVSGGLLSTRQRPNLEIDARVRQKRTNGAAGSRVRLGGRTALDVEVRRERTDFSDAEFGDDTLATALNRETTEGLMAFRLELTPLTTFVLRTGVSYDIFEFSHVRDSDSVTVLPGLELKPFALVSGKAFVGVRRFDAKSAAVPDFSGVVAAVDVSYVMREVTRFGVKLDRNLDYSFRADQPYFVATSAGLEVKQALGFTWDVVARLGRATLSYQGLRPAAGLQPAATQRDAIESYGLGLGRRLGDNIRVGFDADRSRRRSNAAARGYEGFRFGGSITYGY